MTPSRSLPGMFSSRPRDGAEREEDGREAVAAQVADGEVAAEPPLELQLHAQRQDLIDLGADQVARQAVLGHALIQHAADDRRRLEQRHAVAEQREVVRAAEPGRAGADDGDAGRRRPRPRPPRPQRPQRRGWRAAACSRRRGAR